MNRDDVKTLKKIYPHFNALRAHDSGYWIKEAEKYLAKSTQHRDIYPVIDHTNGDGPWMHDIEGRKYYDLTSGIAVRAFGFQYKPQVEFEHSIENVMKETYGQGFDTIPQVLLAKKIISLFPGKKKDRQVFFTTSGARVVETAMKSAMDKTHRQRFVAFKPAFHGRTGYALALTASNHKHKDHFPQGVDVIRSWYAYCYRCPYGLKYPSCNMHCVKDLRESIKLEGKDIAAIVFEPMIGEAGFVVPPREFAQGLRQIADEHDAFLIADEVQTGMGRTGKWWCVEHYGVVPDYITSSKAFGGGYSLGATIGPSPMFTDYGRHSETVSAEPFKAYVSSFIIHEIERNGLLKHNELMGYYFMKRLREVQSRYSCIGDIRGLGLMIGVEFVLDPITKEKADDLCGRIVKNLVQKKGLWVAEAGTNCIRLSPYYNITQAEIDMVADKFERAVAEEWKKTKKKK